MNKFVRQAQELQAKLAKAQEELGELTVEATSGGGAVKVIIDGKQKIRSVTIAGTRFGMRSNLTTKKSLRFSA